MQQSDKTLMAARHLLRTVARATLGTVLRDSDGAPYVSLVSAATDQDGAPLLLLSNLADHTKNLERDPRVSLLLDGSLGQEDPLAGERLTVQGTLALSAEPRHRQRYLARHAVAALYADFADFAFYRLTMTRAHLIAGFGRIHWLDGEQLLIAPSPALAAAEADIVAHMNEDHQVAVQLYANRLLGRRGEGWRMTGIDPEGIDLRQGGETARLVFDRAIADAAGARAELIRLAERARAEPPP
jgi:hypothetical protein